MRRNETRHQFGWSHGSHGSQGPSGIPPRPSPSLVQVWRHFATFFGGGRWGLPAPKGQNNGFPRSGWIWGVWGRKGAVQGSQMDPLDGPIPGLVEGDTFSQTPLFRGVDSPVAEKGGLRKSIALDQTGCGAVQRVHLGPLNRTFPAPYFPGSALSAENHCFGPSGQSVSFRRRYPAEKKCQT